jgi:hypothetical protein
VRKNDKQKPKQQARRGTRAVSQLKLAITAFIRETLYETVLVSGFETVMELLEQERAEVCGPWYRHAAERTAYPSGHVASSLVLGGRRVNVDRPRVRTIAGEEVVLPELGRVVERGSARPARDRADAGRCLDA